MSKLKYSNVALDSRLPLGNLDILANQVVEGFIIGLHKSPFHGFSVEFAEHRLYNQGDYAKNIDWKVYGRTDKMFTKRFEEETNLRCQVVIDASSSMYFPKKVEQYYEDNKMGFSVIAAAALMNLMAKQRDAFGLSIFDASVNTHTVCKSSTTHLRMMYSYMEQLLKDKPENKKTDAVTALHQIADSIHKRSLVAIFSDMFDGGEDQEKLFAALQHLKHNKHEVMLFHVVDKAKELDFEFDNRPHLFIDVESGERVMLQPQQVKEHYVKQVSEFTNNLKNKCLQYKVDYVEADINQGYRPILQQYLVKRQKMG
jgi:uncharacterized protein (DUF58 family)